jgi:hypothetical protein
MAHGLGDYQYDVFFSYKRHSLTSEWTREVHRRLQFWLSQEIGYEARLFVDEDTVEVGDHWPEKLREGLRLSKCMVGLWSPMYFQSDWCVSEWRSFLEREKRLSLRPHGLIAPLRFHDGEHFPPEAREVEWTDVAPYTTTVPAFWTSQRAIELEDCLKSFVASLAHIIRRAPPFSADWPVVEAIALPREPIGLARL